MTGKGQWLKSRIPPAALRLNLDGLTYSPASEKSGEKNMNCNTPESLLKKSEEYERKAHHLRRLLIVEEYISHAIEIPEPKFNFNAPDGASQGENATMTELGNWYRENWERHREEFKKCVEAKRIEIEGEG